MNTRSYAQVNHGRWVVECPAPDCRAALRAPATVCDCRDETVCDHPAIPCNATIRTVMPNDTAEIERLLNLRPSRPNRNWYPGETVASLKAENVQHGVRI